MSEKLWEVRHCDWLQNGLPDHCAQLIIADPPYYRVKGEFDYVWPTMEDWLRDVEQWADECNRVLAYNGTLVWYGFHKTIAYVQTLLDKKFNLLNNCTIVKRNSIQATLGSIASQRSFFSNEERFLVYEYAGEVKNSDGWLARHNYALALDALHCRLMKPLSSYFIDELARTGLTARQMDALTHTNMPSRHWFSANSQFELCTEPRYEQLRGIMAQYCDKPLPRPYEELRREYEELRRPWLMNERLSDAIATTWKTFTTEHPTAKDLKFTRALIRIMSRPNDLVLAPFAGSGTEGVAALQCGRRFFGTELDENYCDMARANIEKAAFEPSFI